MYWLMIGFDNLYHDQANKYFWCLVTVANVKVEKTVFTGSAAVEWQRRNVLFSVKCEPRYG